MALGQAFRFWFCKYIDPQAVFGFWPIPVGNHFFFHDGFGFSNLNGIAGTIRFVQSKCRFESDPPW